MQKWIDFGFALVNLNNACGIFITNEDFEEAFSVTVTDCSGNNTTVKIEKSSLSSEEFENLKNGIKDTISDFITNDEKLLSLKK